MCNACLSHHRRENGKPIQRAILRDCGRPAVTLILVKVGEKGDYEVKLPLCGACLRVEEDFISLVKPQRAQGGPRMDANERG